MLTVLCRLPLCWHMVLEEGAGSVFSASMRGRVQADIFYSCNTISEKLKVTFRVLSILKRQIFSVEFWKLMGLLKVLNICFG